MSTHKRSSESDQDSRKRRSNLVQATISVEHSPITNSQPLIDMDAWSNIEARCIVNQKEYSIAKAIRNKWRESLTVKRFDRGSTVHKIMIRWEQHHFCYKIHIKNDQLRITCKLQVKKQVVVVNALMLKMQPEIRRLLIELNKVRQECTDTLCSLIVKTDSRKPYIQYIYLHQNLNPLP